MVILHTLDRECYHVLLPKNQLPISCPLYPNTCSEPSEKRFIIYPHWPEFCFSFILHSTGMNLESLALWRTPLWWLFFIVCTKSWQVRTFISETHFCGPFWILGTHCLFLSVSLNPFICPSFHLFFFKLTWMLDFGDLGLWTAVSKVSVSVGGKKKKRFK